VTETHYEQPCVPTATGYCFVHQHQLEPPASVPTELASQAAWQTPPISYRNRNWLEVMEMLHSRPGEWLFIGDLVPISVANAIRQGRIAALRDGVTVKTRNNTRGENRTLSLYLKWDTPAARRKAAKNKPPKQLPKEN
jgi:hypothetical protein